MKITMIAITTAIPNIWSRPIPKIKNKIATTVSTRAV